MTARPHRHRDSAALALAAIATFALRLFGAPAPVLEGGGRRAADAGEAALEGLMDAEAAQAAGGWWLDEQRPGVRLSFAPEHERLVWVVEGSVGSVVLDAETGEALGFEFE